MNWYTERGKTQTAANSFSEDIHINRGVKQAELLCIKALVTLLLFKLYFIMCHAFQVLLFVKIAFELEH